MSQSKLFFVANPSLKTEQSGKNTDEVHADIDAIPVGTTLDTAYDCLEIVGGDSNSTAGEFADIPEALLTQKAHGRHGGGSSAATDDGGYYPP